MDRQHHITGGGGVKVTYIETQFVTSDAAGFKDLVQRLTGRSPTGAGAGAAQAPAAPPHRPPRACGAGEGTRTTTAAGAGLQGYRYGQAAGGVRPAAVVASRAPPCYEDLLLGTDDFSDLFYVGAAEQQRHGLTGGYSDFLY